MNKFVFKQKDTHVCVCNLAISMVLNICHVWWLVLEFSYATTIAKFLKVALSDPCLTLHAPPCRHVVIVCADLGSVQIEFNINRSVSSLLVGLLVFGLPQCCRILNNSTTVNTDKMFYFNFKTNNYI